MAQVESPPKSTVPLSSYFSRRASRASHGAPPICVRLPLCTNVSSLLPQKIDSNKFHGAFCFCGLACGQLLVEGFAGVALVWGLRGTSVDRALGRGRGSANLGSLTLVLSAACSAAA